jgi:hypothetical protein
MVFVRTPRARSTAERHVAPETAAGGDLMGCEAATRENWLVDWAEAEGWIRAHVDPVGPIEAVHERAWSTVLRVPLAKRIAWFKACAPVQAFEPRLTGELFERWPDRVPEVLGRDDDRAWLLLADAGTPMRALGNPPEVWMQALPLYAELQRGEAVHAPDHLAHGVPDLRVPTWPAQYEALLREALPLERHEIVRLRQFDVRFSQLCGELIAHQLPETLQHDDLHMANVYKNGDQLRVLDWGDTSIAHPFGSLVIMFRFLEEINRLPPTDPWFARLRDAYLEPWGSGHIETFELAMRLGTFARAFAIARQRAALPEGRRELDSDFQIMLRRALTQICD